MSRASIEHWNANQVAAVPDDISEWHSQALLDWRNQQYPRLLELMPVNYPGRTVIDFGCGPGHDTIMHNAALECKRMFERFYCFDAIKDDACPCCGGRVQVVEETSPPSVVLRSTHGVVVEPSSGLKVWDPEAREK